MRYWGKLGLIGLLWLMLLPAQAGMVSTAESAAQTAPPAVTIEPQRQRVAQELVARGVGPAEAAARIARMTDRQVAALDGKLETLPAGGDMSTTNLLLIIIIIILLI